MDPLIRAAQLAPLRMRLSEARGDAIAPTAAPAGAIPADGSQALRHEIETQLRGELSAQLQAACEHEFERARSDGQAAAVAAAEAATSLEIARIREQLQARVTSALTALERGHQQALSKLQTRVGEIAFAALCRLVGEEGRSPAFIMSMVENLCAQLRGDTIATVRLHSRDIRALGELLQPPVSIQALQLNVLPDDSLTLGGCVIEAASGHYNGALDEQLRRLHAVLTAPVAQETER